MAYVTKGWFVEGVVEPPKGDAYKIRSRVFHVHAAAVAYRAELEKSGRCKAGSCVVRTRFGNDKIKSEMF